MSAQTHTPDAEGPALYSVRAARQRAGGLGNTLAYELMAQGKWVAVKICGRTFITADSLDAFIAALPPANLRTGLRKAAARAADIAAT